MQTERENITMDTSAQPLTRLNGTEGLPSTALGIAGSDKAGAEGTYTPRFLRHARVQYFRRTARRPGSLLLSQHISRRRQGRPAGCPRTWEASYAVLA